MLPLFFRKGQGMQNFQFGRIRPVFMRHRVLTMLLALLCVAFMSVWLFERVTGTSVFVRFGALIWIPVHEDAAWLPKSVRLAMKDPPPTVRAGELVWREAAPGFEVAELSVLAGDQEAERLLLARVDPARFRFEVRNHPSGAHNLSGWMRDTHAALIINGSYYARSGLPSTPVLSAGQRLGPNQYEGTHGAFVAAGEGVRLVDLAATDWRAALNSAENAMVSYPLLRAADGSNRVPAESGWLASRTFIAMDRDNRVVIGSTRGSFFTLTRLADFLSNSPLHLVTALNLDGGPVSCQAIAIGAFRRRHCGDWELQTTSDGRARMLPSAPWAEAPMPVALAVFPR